MSPVENKEWKTNIFQPRKFKMKKFMQYNQEIFEPQKDSEYILDVYKKVIKFQ